MFDRRPAAEWHAELRAPGRKLTAREAERLALFDLAASVAELHQDICEIKGRLTVIDLWLERTVPGYRHPSDMVRLREGR